MNSANTWPLRTVARAADVDTRTLRQWFGTGVLHLRGDDRKSTGKGHQVGLSRFRSYEAAIVQLLNRHGVSVSRAARAAFEFTINRTGQLFPIGRTILVLGPSGDVVSQVEFDSSIFNLSNGAVALCVDLNRICDQVNSVLNKH